MARDSKQLVDWIKTIPNINIFWEDTKSVMPNCLIQFYTQIEFEEITRSKRGRYHYAFCLIHPYQDTPPKYCAAIVVSEEALLVDIAHELCHLYIHGSLGYPWPWLDETATKEQETLQIRKMSNYATRIYDSTIHPIVDKVLENRLLFDPIIYERLYTSFLSELQQYLKNPNTGDSTYILTRMIELQNRLPDRYQVNLDREFGARKSYSRLLQKIETLPKFPDPLTPSNVSKYIIEMWKQFNIDPDLIQVSLLNRTPMLIV